jgi:DMSO/TMAO reductase YedYZ heme-binding membrane subunit
VAVEHATKIYTVAIVGIIVVIAFLALTSVGHVIDAATQHFMLFYAGVFALIGLCASVGLGLVATDRMFLNPGRRVFIQSAHRAASFGAVAFLIIHIITEILAQRVHVLDAVIPFLSPFRTFYIGLGTIASDLIILLVITGIMRGRFNSSGKAWRWRAIHYASYLSFVFGVWHGLLGGRPGKPYVDWSYGFVIAFVLLGLAIRVLSNSLRPKESLSSPPVDQSASSASAPLRAAAMLAQYGAVRSGRNILGAGTGSQPVLSAPLSAPVLTALPAGTASDPGQPYYEPGYEGPPRYLGAPRATGSGPMPRAATGPLPRAATGPFPTSTGPLPRATGPMPRATGPMPRATGPLPPPVSGPMPRSNSGPMPRAGSGPMPRAGSGPMPRAATGPMPRAGTGPFPAGPPRPQPPQSWPGTGPMPRAATGPLPQAGGGRPADWETGPRTWPGPGPVPPGSSPRGATGPRPRAATGPMAPGTGPRPWPGTGPIPQDGAPVPPSGRRGGYGDGQPDHQGWPDAGYGGGYGDGQPDRQGWPDAGYDGSWYPEEPQWEGRFPETDPNLRYREPGPGMPGYRGSREHRYGGDRY